MKAIHFLRLYPPGHPFCAQAVEASSAAIRRFHQWHGPLAVEVTRDSLVLDEASLPPDGSVVELAELLYPEGIRSFTLEVGIESREVAELLDVLSGQGEGDEDDD